MWHRGLMTKLQQLDITGDLLHLFSSYLTGRSLRVVFKGHTASFPVEASALQGSNLGSILWNIHFNDLLQSIPSATVCADDLHSLLGLREGGSTGCSAFSQRFSLKYHGLE